MRIKAKCWVGENTPEYTELTSGTNITAIKVKGALKKTHPIAATARSFAEAAVLGQVASYLNTNHCFDGADIWDLYGNKRFESQARENSKGNGPKISVHAVGEHLDVQDIDRRPGITLKTAVYDHIGKLLDEYNPGYYADFGSMTDIYAATPQFCFRQFMSVSIDEVYVIRMNFPLHDGDVKCYFKNHQGVYEGKATVKDGIIWYKQHEDAEAYESHTVDIEKQWQSSTIEFPYQRRTSEGFVEEIVRWSRYTVGTVADYTVYKYKQTHLPGRRTCDLEEDSLQKLMDRVTWVNGGGRTCSELIFTELAEELLRTTMGNGMTRYGKGRVRRELNARITDPHGPYAKLCQRLTVAKGSTYVTQVFYNTLAYVTDREEHVLMDISASVESFLSKHLYWFKVVVGVFNYLCGTSYTPVGLAHQVWEFFIKRERTITDWVVGTIEKIGHYFSKTPEPVNLFEMTTHGKTQTQDFKVASSDILDPRGEPVQEGALAIQRVYHRSQNVSKFTDKQVEEFVSEAEFMNNEEVVVNPCMFTFAYVGGKAVPNDMVAMMNKTFPKVIPEAVNQCQGLGDCRPGDILAYETVHELPQPAYDCKLGEREDAAYRRFYKLYDVSRTWSPQLSTAEDYLAKKAPAFKMLRKSKALSAIETIDHTIEELSRIPIFPKQDEMNRGDYAEDGLAAKMRAIFNVDPRFQALHAELNLIYNEYAEFMDRDVTMKIGRTRWRFRVTPCSAKNPGQLATLMSEAHSLPRNSVLMGGAGDDVIVFIRWGNGRLCAYGKDVATCDSSLTFHSVQHWLNFLQEGGLGNVANEMYTFHARAQAYFRASAGGEDGVDEVRLNVLEGFWRTFSGGWDTTVKNGFIVNYKLFIAIIELLEEIPNGSPRLGAEYADSHFHSTGQNFNSLLEKQAATLGLVLTDEPIRDQDPKYATFLKCYWVPRLDGEGYVFMRLPSAILTMGKTRTNWIHSTPGKNPLRSARYACHALARGHGIIDRKSMILGPYLDMLDRVSIAWDWQKKNYSLGLFHRLQEEGTFKDFIGEEIPVDLKFVEDYVLVRYGLTPADVSEFEAFCSDITYENYSPFTKVNCFDFLNKLREVDYGEAKELKAVLTAST